MFVCKKSDNQLANTFKENWEFHDLQGLSIHVFSNAWNSEFCLLNLYNLQSGRSVVLI